MACPWPFLANLDSPATLTVNQSVKSPISGKSFAQILSGDASDVSFLAHLPPKVVQGTSVRVKISRAAYESGLAACRTHLHGRLTLHKGDAPVTTLALKAKLSSMWPHLHNWSLIPLGKGFFELKFNSIEDMRGVWAVGTVNLKPGLMRFYRWTKDFVPQAQSQTHAQIWVRFLNLPQEYWERQTLFEIASGLGTPLSMDDNTQHRKLGIFARVLIDVDLSGKLFDSVVVEREDHALSVSVQYEKYPLFCANCKKIGHSIQNCSKLGTTNSVQVTAPKKSASVPLKPGVTLKKSVTVPGNQSVKDARYMDHSVENEGLKDSSIEVEEGIMVQHHSDCATINKGHQDLDKGKSSDDTLTLRNTFDLLDPDSENEILVANTEDKELSLTKVDRQIAKNPSVEEVPLGKLSKTHNTEPVTEFEEEILPSQKFNQVESHAADKPSSTELTMQNSFELLEENEALVPGEARPIDGDLPSLTVEKVPGIIDRQCAIITAPIFDDNITLQPIITPITTTDEILGPDKRKVQVTVGPKNMSAACLKDFQALSKFLGVAPDTDTITTTDEVLVPAKGKVQVSGGSKNVSVTSMKSVILSKSWGDEVDTDPATDGTMEQDTDSENLLATLKFPPDADKYLDTPLEIEKFTKSGRKYRKHKSPNGNGYGGSSSSEHIQTRSKKGVIKSNPKYV